MSENREPDSKTSTESGSPKPGPAPIFESFIYDFAATALAGDGSGRPGTIGGPIGGQNPKFRVLTYQFVPPSPPNIDNT